MTHFGEKNDNRFPVFHCFWSLEVVWYPICWMENLICDISHVETDLSSIESI